MCYNKIMNENEIKRIELETQNLMKYRDNCINYIALVIGGSLGLLIMSFSYLKLILIICGFVLASFLFVLANIIDKDVENKIKELK